MKTIVYLVIGLILLSVGPQLILGAVFTVGIYYVLYLIFSGLFGGGSGGGLGGGRDSSGSGWHGTGNPHM